MRRAVLLTCASAALAAAAACATSGEEEAAQLSPNDAGANSLPDAGMDDSGDVFDSAVPVVRSCSDADWCITALPDRDLTLKDIWPFERRAFAIAESNALGVKVLEWDDVSNKWSYIDDNTQNEYGFGQYAGKLWGPNENEVYYGVAPAFIYHGTRSSPSAPWSWQRSRLEDHSRDDPSRDHGRARYVRAYPGPSIDYPALGVWGTSAEDVYAWYANTIFRWKSDDGGAPGWVAEYVADDSANLTDTFFIFGASGSGPDDVWFAGGRARHDATGIFPCAMVIHKTPDGYRRLVDHVIRDTDKFGHSLNACQPKAGALNFTSTIFWPGFGELSLPTTRGAWMTNVESAGPGAAVGILGGSHFAYVTAEDGGAARANGLVVATTRATTTLPTIVNSVWSHGTDTWISGWGLVLRTANAPSVWAKGNGLYPEGSSAGNDQPHPSFVSISTTVLNGAPLDIPVYQVRGTSNTNLWAIGPRYALHKTTP